MGNALLFIEVHNDKHSVVMRLLRFVSFFKKLIRGYSMLDDKIYSLDEISRFLQDKRLYHVERKTGICYPILMRLKKRNHNNFTLSTLKAISVYMSMERARLENGQ